MSVRVVTGGGLIVSGQIDAESMLGSKIAAAIFNTPGVELRRNGFFEAYLPCLGKSNAEEKAGKIEAFRRLLAQRSGVQIAIQYQ